MDAVGRRGGGAWAWAQVLLGIALAAGCLYLAMRNVSVAELAVVWSGVRAEWVLLAGLTFVITMLVKAMRWRVLFGAERPDLSLAQLATLLAAGQATNMLLPARLGELGRAYLTGSQAGTSRLYVLGTLAAEKILDVAALAVLLVVLAITLPLPGALAERAPLLVAPALVVVAGAAVLWGTRRRWQPFAARVLGERMGGRGSRWRGWLEAGVNGLAAAWRNRSLPAAAGWTVLIWLLAGITNLALFPAFALPADLAPAFVLLAVLQVGVAPPSTPGKVGIFEYLSVLALGPFGVPAPQAITYSIVLHLLVLGITGVWAALGLVAGRR